MFKRRLTVLMVLLGSVLVAQTKVDVSRQGTGYSFLQPPFPKPVRSGVSLPLNCSAGELYFLTSAPAGGNLHVCHADGQWAPQGSAGPGNLTILNDGTVVGVRPVANLRTGTGILQIVTDTGSQIDIQQGVDTALVMTKGFHQSGAALHCNAGSTDGIAYSCSMTPTLGLYTPGMLVYWKPETDNTTGAVTLEIDALGAKPVVLDDGTSLPKTGEFRGGSMYPLWFDGNRFRSLPAIVPKSYQTVAEYQNGTALYCESGGTLGAAYECSVSPSLTRYEEGLLLHWRPDVDSAGGATTLSVNGLGEQALTLGDGSSRPVSGELKAGELYLVWHDGTKFRIVGETGEKFALREEYQTGEALRCESSGTVGSEYRCSTNPPFGVYVRGMVIHWIPDVDSPGGEISLDVNGIGASVVRLADGINDPAPGDLRAGRMHAVWFDGYRFRMLTTPNAALSSVPLPVCRVTLRGRIWFVAGEVGLKDEMWVCAKGDDDQYEWRILY